MTAPPLPPRDIGLKFYRSLFGFSGRGSFVEYGDRSIPSHGWWIIPWEDEDISFARELGADAHSVNAMVNAAEGDAA